MPRWRHPVRITVVRLSGESNTFFPVMRHHSMRGFLEWVRVEMVPTGRQFKLLLGGMEIDPCRVGIVRPPHIQHWPEDDGYFDQRRLFPKVEVRHYGIWEDTTLTLVLM
jgi:hypothetical protein